MAATVFAKVRVSCVHPKSIVPGRLTSLYRRRQARYAAARLRRPLLPRFPRRQEFHGTLFTHADICPRDEMNARNALYKRRVASHRVALVPRSKETETLRGAIAIKVSRLPSAFLSLSRSFANLLYQCLSHSREEREKATRYRSFICRMPNYTYGLSSAIASWMRDFD